MPRPTMDVNSPEYQKILHRRQMYKTYGLDYKDVMWAEERLVKLERKMPYGDYTDQDRQDFERIKKIHARIIKRRSGHSETAENHTTTHYIWHTRGDNKVRSEHAANDGKIFAWNDPPPTGHPGEDYGCRCRAEAYREEIHGLKEHSRQTVIFSMPDKKPAWVREDFFDHYNHGNGKMVQLQDIGHLQNIIEHARSYDQGGGSIFKRVEKDIIRQARENGIGSFYYNFNNSYEFQPAVFEIGGATVEGAGMVKVTDKENFWQINVDIDYAFFDRFTKPWDYADTGLWPLTINTGDPYPILGNWTTQIEILVKK